MRRILLMVLRNLLIVPGDGLNSAIGLPMWINIQKKIIMNFALDCFRANKGGNVTIDVHGQENIPKQDGFMFFQIIKACMMYWQLLKRVRTLFCCS